MKSAAVAIVAVAVLAADLAAQGRGTRSTSSKPAATATTAVRLTVRDSAGNPVGDARVTLSGDSSGELTTGGAGTAILPELKDGTYRVHVEHAGFVPFEREFVLQRGSPKAIDLTLTAAPPPPAPPPPPPAAKPKALPPPGSPVSLSVVDYLDRNFIGKEPSTESVVACAPMETVRVLQIRESVASHAHADVDEVLYVVAGEGTAHLDEQSVGLKPGVLLLVPRTRSHSLERRGKNPLMLLSTLAGAPCHEAVSSK